MYPETIQSQELGNRVFDVSAHLPVAVAHAIRRLQKAWRYSQETGRNPWEFAITIAELRRDGASENDLRWLVCRGYVEHAKEVTSTSGERAFDRRVSLRFSKRTAFVITDTGLSLEPLPTAQVNASPVDGSTMRLETLPSVRWSNLVPRGNLLQLIVPKWDRDRRELRLGDKLVKVFKLPSPLQEAILMAFEEENWPARIDDPLPVHPDLLPKRRLHDAIKSLNRNQKNCLIRFMGDGTGEGIRWELISDVVEPKHTAPILDKRRFLRHHPEV